MRLELWIFFVGLFGGVGLFLVIQSIRKENARLKLEREKLLLKQERKRAKDVEVLITKADSLLKSILRVLGNNYLNHSKYLFILKKFKVKFEEIKKERNLLYENFGLIFDIFEQSIFPEIYNDEYIIRSKKKYSKFFKEIDEKGFGLTDKQLESVFTNEDAVLINAGAGTGKTKTIESKVLHLVLHKNVPLDKILVMTYSKSAQLDMLERISTSLEKGNIPFDEDVLKDTVTTFHAFGKKILDEENNNRRNTHLKKSKSIGKGGKFRSVITDDERRIVIKEVLQNIKSQSTIQKFISEYILYYSIPQVSVKSFESLSDYYQYTKRTYKSLLKNTGGYNESMKSYGEVLIANYLWLNKIQVEYEPKGHYYTDDLNRKRQYRPDFYLPEHKIYIEYFGVDKQGNAAPDISTKEYLRRVDQKINAHKESGNILIDIRYADLQDGQDAFLKKLLRELKSHGVKLSPIPPEDMIEMREISKQLEGLAKTLNTFLSLYKESHSNIEELRKKVLKKFDTLNMLRNNIFLYIFEAYLEEYTRLLVEGDYMDFGDMIYESINLIESGQVERKFDYILIDEFQDMSQARAQFIKSLVKTSDNDCRLFCVGDDWQSIYQFAASDIKIFTHFPDYFGFTKEITLDKTFRFNQGISDISGGFIMMNPEQKEKVLKSGDSTKDGRIVIVQKDPEDNDSYFDFILGQIRDDSGENKDITVLLLTRYNRNKYGDDMLMRGLEPFRIENTGESKSGKKVNKFKFVISDDKDVTVTVLTSHSAKGLEADYVVLDYVDQGVTYDFPSNFEDDPILQIILSDKNEGYRFSEERRIFYVSMTRGRRICFLCYAKGKESLFLRDILELDSGNKVHTVKYLTNNINDISLFQNHVSSDCPICSGKLIVEEDEDGVETTRCKHYPRCPFLQTRFYGDLITCPNPTCCNAMVIRKNGTTGEKFWGCSKYVDGCLGSRPFEQ